MHSCNYILMISEMKNGRLLMQEVQQAMLETITVYDILDQAKQETGIDIKDWYEKAEVV